MPRKSDPVVGILKFFREADYAVASTLLGIVKAEVTSRAPKVEKPVKRTMRAKKLAQPPVNQATPIGQPAAVAEVKVPRKRRTKAEMAAAQAGPIDPLRDDLALPGIGPATVGD